jgi:hypothetical protein
MRRSIVLSLPLQLAFPAKTIAIALSKGEGIVFKVFFLSYFGFKILFAFNELLCHKLSGATTFSRMTLQQNDIFN